MAKVNELMGKGIAVLHIYGPVEDKYLNDFHALLDKHEEYVEHKGSVPSG